MINAESNAENTKNLMLFLNSFIILALIDLSTNMLQELLACLILVVTLWHIKRKWFSPFADFPRPDTLPLIGTLTKYWNSDYMDTTLEIAKDFKEPFFIV